MKKALAVLLTFLVLSPIVVYYRVLPARENSVEIDRLVYNISYGLEDVRGLKFRSIPAVVVITREEAMKKWGPAKQSPEELWIKERLYKMTLLVPSGYNLTESEKRQTAGWVALISGRTMYIIRENFYRDPSQAYGVIAHELTHVLQSQYFEVSYPNEFDGYLAVRALVEGDATLSAVIYCRENRLPVERLSSYTDDPLINLNFFPYIAGYDFVKYLYDEGGWKLVNEAYINEPSSEKVIMFPELYIQGWEPEKVNARVPEGYRIVHTDRLGAFYVFQIAQRAGDNGEEYARYWNGDNATLAFNGSRTVLVWNVTFERKDIAERFAGILGTLAGNETYANYTVKIEGNSVLLIAERRD